MDFGRVTERELNGIDFSLPEEPVFNRQFLTGKKDTNLKIYIGCAKWGRTEWLGKIYPPKTKEKDFLQQYVQHYNCIELNATHYKVYGAAAIEKWAAQAKGKDFLFCPKMYQGVTHKGNLYGKNFLTSEFLRGVTAFKEHLGPVFIQVSETYSPKRKDDLFHYLQSLPTDMQFFVEVRHRSWFENTEERNELLQTLQSLHIGAVITDTAGRRDCCHMHLTVPKVFIRYVGNSLHPSDYSRTDAWINRMKYWIDNGLKEIYFFMHMHDETFSPELTVYLVDKINAACSLHLLKPQFFSNNNAQGSLF
jgi:uncharacterized protein YecE (DUF72 family)